MDWLYGAVWGLALAFAGYLALAVIVTAFQRRLIYKPDPRRTTPDEDGHDDVDVLHIPTPDGETLVAWYALAMTGQPTILYFHGNKGYIELRSDRLADLTSRGFGVLMPSMRGYGGSTGTPSEENAIADAKLIYDCLRNSGVAASDIVVFGESLGTGIATQLAASRKAGALVLDSPYTAMSDLAARLYPWLPVRRMLWDHFETVHHIKRVTVPVLVVHGEADSLVPVDMGRTVYEAAVAPKTLLTYPRAKHLEHLPQGSFDDVERWIGQMTVRERTPSVVSHLHPWQPVHYEKARG